MILGLKIICGAFAALMALFGVRWWFDFTGIAAEWQVESLNNLGVNNLTADMGALFFGTAILIGLGLRPGKSFWLLSAAVLMLVAAAGRLWAYASVGYEAGSVTALIVEVASAALLWFTHTRMSSSV